MTRLVGIVGLLAAFSGCVGPVGWGGWSDPSACVVVPVSTEALPLDWSLRARVKLTFRDQEVGLEVIARKTPEELVVVGISQAGSRLFAVRQRERELAIESHERALDPLAGWLMDALHRAIFIEPPVLGTGDRPASWLWAGERVTEQWGEDGLRQRVFTHGDESSNVGRVTIDYPAHSDALGAIQVRNPSCGYQAAIVVLERTGSGTGASRTEPQEPRGSTR